MRVWLNLISLVPTCYLAIYPRNVFIIILQILNVCQLCAMREEDGREEKCVCVLNYENQCLEMIIDILKEITVSLFALLEISKIFTCKTR